MILHYPISSFGEFPINRQTHRPLHTLKFALYILAGFVLALGLIAGISLMAGASNVHKLLLPFQLMGAGAIANLIAPYLTSLIGGLGVFVLVVSLVLSILLFAVGRLLGHMAALELRIAHLEAQTGS
jgi:hypothetical protein